MKIVVEYYDRQEVSVVTEKGYRYRDIKSVLVKTEEHEVETPEDKEALFKTIYHRNNSLRYCNGCYWKFVDEKVQDEYGGEFMRRYNTISNYYGGGVVD